MSEELVISNDLLKEFIQALKDANGQISSACRLMGISNGYQVVSKWRNEFPWFDNEINTIIENKLMIMNDKAMEMATREKNPDGSMMRFFLTQHPYAKRMFGYAKTNEVKVGATLSYVDMVESNRIKNKKKDKKEIIEGKFKELTD